MTCHQYLSHLSNNKMLRLWPRRVCGKSNHLVYFTMSSVKLNMPYAQLQLQSIHWQWVLVWPTAFKTMHQYDIVDICHWHSTRAGGNRKRDTSPIEFEENPGVRALYAVNQGLPCDSKFIKITILNFFLNINNNWQQVLLRRIKKKLRNIKKNKSSPLLFSSLILLNLKLSGLRQIK